MMVICTIRSDDVFDFSNFVYADSKNCIPTDYYSALVEAGEGIGLNFIIKRQQKDKVLSKVAQATMINRSRMRDVDDTRQDFEELDSAINAGLYLKENMNRNNEDFYYMHTIIEVTANDPDVLEYRTSNENRGETF